MADKTDIKVMNGRQLKKHYLDAVDYLDRHHAYFLTHILHIGRPQWTEAVKTAAVAMQKKEDDPEDYDFDFLFSPKFASQLTTENMAFILAHETFHIILNHLKLVDQFFDRQKRLNLIKKLERKERLTKDELKDYFTLQQVSAKFNIAADCVINDYLVNAGFKPLTIDGKVVGMYGMEQIGEDAAYLTVNDVFERLPEQKQQDGQCQSCGGTGQKPEDDQKDEKGDKGEGQDGKDEGKGDGQSDEEGENSEGGEGKAHGKDGKGEPCPDCQGSGKGQGQGMGAGDGDGRGEDGFDSHDWLLDPDFADKMADAIDKLNDEIEKQGKLPQDVQDKKDEESGGMTAAQQALNNSLRHGSEEGNIREFQEQHGLSMAWAKLLKEVDPNIFKEPGIAPPPRPAWHKRPRKLGAFREVNLPVYQRNNPNDEKRSKEKPAIVLALDYSGSIGPHDADRFASLAKSIPQERIKVFACTFTTSYREHDLDAPMGGGGGGTDFNCIESFIKDKVRPELNGEYPKAVVVITDGQAPFTAQPRDEKERAAYLWLLSPDRTHGYPAAKEIGRWAMLEEYIAN
jgi:hypothetical protein